MSKATGLKQLEADLATNPGPANPFMRDAHGLGIRHDTIRVMQDPEQKGGLVVLFMWRGKETYRLPMEGCDFAQGQVLEIVGIEGIMRVKLTS